MNLCRTGGSLRASLFTAALTTNATLAQVPHTFNNGEVADAEKINQNFNYVLENASGGCTVEQVDNSAEITCADGSSAIVPGYGTVVLVPEGSASGVVPAEVINSGTITLVDGSGDYLAPFSTIIDSGPDIVGVVHRNGLTFPTNNMTRTIPTLRPSFVA